MRGRGKALLWYTSSPPLLTRRSRGICSLVVRRLTSPPFDLLQFFLTASSTSSRLFSALNNLFSALRRSLSFISNSGFFRPRLSNNPLIPFFRIFVPSYRFDCNSQYIFGTLADNLFRVQCSSLQFQYVHPALFFFYWS